MAVFRKTSKIQLLMEGQFILFNVDIPLPPTIQVSPEMLGMAMGMEQALALCLMSVHQQQIDRKKKSARRSANHFGHWTRHPELLFEENICTRTKNSATLSYVIRLMCCLNTESSIILLLNPFVPGNKLMGNESISGLFEDYKTVLVRLPLLQWKVKKHRGAN